jgi:hypothetical protein
LIDFGQIFRGELPIRGFDVLLELLGFGCSGDRRCSGPPKWNESVSAAKKYVEAAKKLAVNGRE